MENIIKDIAILILAGGKGKRMESELPKVLAPLKGETMIMHIVKELQKVTTQKPIAIVGHKAELVREHLGELCSYVIQEEQLGTGHAVSCAKEKTKDAKHILVLSGDQPFIKSETIINLINKHINSEAKITLTTTTVSDFEDFRKGFNFFGRIKRENGKITGIKEYKDADEEERDIKEVNAGCYIFEADWLWKNLENIKAENVQKEYYLTDLLHIASTENEKIESIDIEPYEALGANTKSELETLESLNLEDKNLKE